MASGYTRQALANIQPNLDINAEDLNAEFNVLANAFDNTSGHDHSGSAVGDGSKIILTTSVTGVLPVANGGTGATSKTGTGIPVFQTSPTIITPIIASITGPVTITTGGLTVSTGGITVTAGGIIVTGNSNVFGTLGTGGLSVTANGASIVGNSVVTGALTVNGTLNANESQDSGARVFSPHNAFKTTNYVPTDPTGSTSVTGVMAGLGTTIQFAPVISTQITITISGNFRNNTSGAAGYTNLTYGTGTPPANGAAIVGTVIGRFQECQDYAATTGMSSFCFSVGVGSLSLGVTYWFDLYQQAVGGGTTNLFNVLCNIHEI